MVERSMYPRMVVAFLALLGLFDSLYLSFERVVGNASLVCPTGGGCEIVAQSAQSLLFGVMPVAYLGVLGYTMLLILALAGLQSDSIGRLTLPALLLSTATIGLLIAGYLVYLQIFVIEAICFWCMLSAAIEAAIWVLAVFDWREYRNRTRSTRVGTALSD